MSEPSSGLPLEFQGEVRLFPLPEFVMFPSNVLPLHVFESRYREMMEDAIQGDHLITIATLMPGFDHEYYSRPPIAPFVCIGKVTGHTKSDQGTYNLALVGLERAEIDHEIEPVRSFRRARVRLVEEGGPKADSECANLTKQLTDSLKRMGPGAEKLGEAFEQQSIALATLTDVLAFHLKLDLDFKLKLLGQPNTLSRAHLLLDHLRAKNSRTGHKRFPRGFSAN